MNDTDTDPLNITDEVRHAIADGRQHTRISLAAACPGLELDQISKAINRLCGMGEIERVGFMGGLQAYQKTDKLRPAAADVPAQQEEEPEQKPKEAAPRPTGRLAAKKSPNFGANEAVRELMRDGGEWSMDALAARVPFDRKAISKALYVLRQSGEVDHVGSTKDGYLLFRASGKAPGAAVKYQAPERTGAPAADAKAPPRAAGDGSPAPDGAELAGLVANGARELLYRAILESGHPKLKALMELAVSAEAASALFHPQA